MGEHLSGPETSYEPPPRPTPPRYVKPRWRKAGRVLLLVAGSIAALLVLLVAGLLVWLHTGGGQRELGAILTHEAANAIQGSLKVHDLHVTGFLKICADGVELRDPDGNKALSADRVCAHVNPIALKAKRIWLSEVELDKPWIELASVTDEHGKQTTTLARALAPKKPKADTQKTSGTFDYVIDVADLAIHGGQVAIRPGVGEPAKFALDDFELGNAHAKYAQDGAEAALQLTAQLKAPGEAPVSLALDARIDGELATGAAKVNSLRVKVGDSTLTAQGAYDLGRSTGELHVRDLAVQPRDVRELMPRKEILSGPIRGEADVHAEPKKVSVDVRLVAGGGDIHAKGSYALGDKNPAWDVEVAVDHVDPGAVSAKAPHGKVTARLAGSGKGTPELDEHGVRGQAKVQLHVGPAELERIGPIVTDLRANLEGRYAIVQAFTATALGLKIKAHGAAALDEVSLDLDVDAPSLEQVGRAVGALTKKPSPPLAGTMHLTARMTGSPRAPDAQVHMRAPWLRFGPNVSGDGVAVDGVLQGDITEPDGELVVVARKLKVGNIDLGAPKIDMGLEWPVAHLRVDAGVKGGAIQLAGDATMDDDKDGLVLSNFIVAWPENQLHLAHTTRVHFGDEIVVEPLDLTSPHGEVRFSAQYLPEKPNRTGKIDAALVLSQFDLAYLPKFAVPQQSAPKGVIDANVVAQGALPHPDFDARVDAHGAGLQRMQDLAADAHLHAHVHSGRLVTDGWVDAPHVVRVKLDGDLPLASIHDLPANAPVKLNAELSQLNLEELGKRAGIVALQKQAVRGAVDLRVLATGTLGAPRATVSLTAAHVETARVKGVDARAGVLVEGGKATLDGDVSLGGERVLALAGQTPFDLAKLLRDPAYLRGALSRPLSADMAIIQLQLQKLAEAGLLPPDSAGVVSLGLHLGGTPDAPTLQLAAVGQKLSVGKLHGLDFQGQLALANDLRMSASAVSEGLVVASMDAHGQVSGAELLEVARSKNDPGVVGPLLDRAVTFNLDIPGLPIGRVQQLAGAKKQVAEGRLTGHVSFSGTPARPSLTARIALKDLQAQNKKLGAADFYVEADSGGALVHLAIDPPGGGNFMGHAQVKADLGARALIRDGGTSILDGALSGTIAAKALDLAFLGGLVPNLRRAGGTLEGAVTLGGTVGKPTGTGDAHLRAGLFDVVGQGVFHDIGLDATFSPKEAVIDRLTGSSGDGTFSAVLVASRRTTDEGDKLEFTGEVHLGDDESARDRKNADGTPVAAHALPLRQAGEQRADVTAELDLFGDYQDGLVNVTAKIPDARVKVLQLPDKKLPKLKENPDVILVHPGEKPHPPGREPEEVEAEAQAQKTANLRVEAHLELNHLYVQAPDFEFPVTSDMRFSYDARDPDNPTADGTVHVPQGSFSALGRRFVIADALITETGGDLEDPELEIKATYENPKATVNITVSGTAKDPQLEMSSNPPMDQDAIAFFLATGRIEGHATQSGGGVDLSSAATSVLGSVLFGQLRKELANVLPVDVLTIETGDKGVSQASVGKYIGDRVYIGYRARLTPAPGENTNEGHVEYEISRSVNAEATIGNVNSDLSLMWTHDF